MNKLDLLIKKADLWNYESSDVENVVHRVLLYKYSQLLISELLQLQREGTDVYEYYGVDSNLRDRRTSVIDLDLSDEEMLEYMLAAHKEDVTFNKFVINALERVIYDHKLNGLSEDDMDNDGDNATNNT
jgi:hypothetical protein